MSSYFYSNVWGEGGKFSKSFCQELLVKVHTLIGPETQTFGGDNVRKIARRSSTSAANDFLIVDL